MKSMKKSLIALSILSSLTVPAMAQSNVTIYGIADVGYTRSNDGSGTSTTTMGSGIESGSRLGFKGVESLGGGLNAIFTLEQGLNMQNGTQAQDRLFGRQAFVGLDGAWGQLSFGRQYLPVRLAVEKLSPFGLGFSGNMKSIFEVYDERADSSAKFTSHKINGFSAEVLYSVGQLSTTSDTLNRQWGLSASYENGPVYVVASYNSANLSTGTPLAYSGNKHTTLVGGIYNFGMLKAHAAFAWNKGDNAAGAKNLDTKDAMVGISMPLGKSDELFASYMTKNNDLTANADTRQWSIGYSHNLSKRTDLYASISKVTNDAGAKLKPSDSASSVVNGADPSTVSVGIRHKF